MRYLFLILLFPLFATSQTLLFKSGFEGGGITVGSLGGGYQYITGRDSTTNFTWPPTFWGSGQNNEPGDPNGESGPNGIHVINATASQVTNQLVTINDFQGNPTTALRQDVNTVNSSPTTQTPYQINNVVDPVDFKYYYKFRIRTDDLSQLSNSGDWRMIWQYKDNNWDDQFQSFTSDDDGYRISLFIVNQSGTLRFRTTADFTFNSASKWWEQFGGIAVPTDQWYTVEMYHVVTDGKNGPNTTSGKFWIKINGTQIAYYDANTTNGIIRANPYPGATLGNNDPVNPVNAAKVPSTMWYWTMWQFYGNKPGTQWIDDVEVWDMTGTNLETPEGDGPGSNPDPVAGTGDDLKKKANLTTN